MAAHAKAKARPAALQRAAGAARGSKNAGRQRARALSGAQAAGETANAFQAKLKIGEPNDRYEREADAVADRVMRMHAPEGAPACRSCAKDRPEPDAPPLQRQEMAEEEETAQTMALQREDMAEEEETAQTMSLQREEMAEEEETAQTMSLQREDMAEEEEPLQARATGKRAPKVTPKFESDLRLLRRSGGDPLPNPLRSFFEPRLGTDLGSVRVHTGRRAQALAEAARARAFTVGGDLVFGSGEYRPSADQGRHLIAHELTHVLQQRGGLHSVQREVEQATSAFEHSGMRRAATFDELVARFGLQGPAGPPAVMRIAHELLRRALIDPLHAQALAAFADDGDATPTVRRVVETVEYRLVLEAQRGGGQEASTWSLSRVEPEALLFTRTTADRREAGGVPSAGTDEQRLSLATPLPPSYTSDPQIVAGGGENGPAPTIPSAASSPAPSASETATAPALATTAPASEALAAVDAASTSEAPPDAQASGESAGKDKPAVARPPIDADNGTETVPEEPEPEPIVVQRRARHGASTAAAVPARLEGDVRAVTQSAGRPLPAQLAASMQSGIGADFSTVRLHDDPRAGELAQSLGAKAFTHGEHIVAPPGALTVVDADGRRLLAHELTHVVQQRSGALRFAGGFLQRQAEECPPPDPIPEIEVVPSPATPGQDPAFRQARNRVGNRAADQATHGEGSERSANANDAAAVLDGENRLHGQTDQVGEMEAQAANPPAFDKAAFIQKVLDEVERTVPDTVEDFFKFADRGKAQGVKQAVTGEVGTATADTRDPLREAATTEPTGGQSPRQPGTLDIQPPGEQPASVRADRAMPPMRTESEIDLRAETTRTENVLKEACITRTYMQEHDDPVLQSGVQAQDEVAQSAAEAPTTFRGEEAQLLETARGRASTTGNQGVEGLHATRTDEFGTVGTTQTDAQRDNEAKREAISLKIDGVFTTTQTKVQDRLTKLDTDVTTKFDEGANAAVSKFEDEMDAEAKRNEKSWLDTLGDWLFGPAEPEQLAFYERGRATFVADMRLVIEDVADVVETGLTAAKQLVEDGKAEVKEILDGLGDELADFRQEKADQINDRFRTLERTVDDKQGQLVSGLAERYVTALQTVQAAEQRIRDAHKNVLERAEDVYNEVKDAVLGWIDRLTTVVGGAATRIIRKPGQFLRNLGAGIVQGLSMFMENIGDNLKNAVVSWLTGNLSSAGVQLPQTFDAKGIIGFLLDLVGLGVAGIKEIARQVFGRRLIAAIEQGVEGAERIKPIFDILQREGPAGLFEHLRSEFVQMKDEVMGKVAEALRNSLIIAGIRKALGVISGLVSGGVGTVITIVSTIIDVILWVRDNAAQLAELASTIAGMAVAVLEGQVAALANAINALLKRLLPLVLGFVGALVGIAGAIRQIQGIFRSIGRPARRAIRSLFVRLKRGARRLLQRLSRRGRGRGRGGRGGRLSPRVIRQRIVQALSQPSREQDPVKAIAETRQLAERLKREYQPRLARGTIRITVLDRSADDVASDGDVDLSVAMSPPTPVSRPVNVTLLEKFKGQIARSHSDARADIRDSIGKIPRARSNIQNWSTVQDELAQHQPIKGIVASPINRRWNFGKSVAPLVDKGVKQAKRSASASALSKAKTEINAGRGFYLEPKTLFQAHIYNQRASTNRIVNSVAHAFTEAGKDAPTEPYNRIRHYGHTPSAADRNYFGAGPDEVVDHNPPLVERYYEGAPGEKEGFKQTQAERVASGRRRDLMELQDRDDSDSQGGQMQAYSLRMRQRYGL